MVPSIIHEVVYNTLFSVLHLFYILHHGHIVTVGPHLFSMPDHDSS